MKALFVTYTGNDFNQAIAEARRRNPNHQGAVIVIPQGLERLLVGGEVGKKGYKVSRSETMFNDTKWLN
jgi:hypothetical protein